MKKNLQIMQIVPAQIKVVNQVAQDLEIFLIGSKECLQKQHFIGLKRIYRPKSTIKILFHNISSRKVMRNYP